MSGAPHPRNRSLCQRVLRTASPGECLSLLGRAKPHSDNHHARILVVRGASVSLFAHADAFATLHHVFLAPLVRAR